MYNQNSYLPYSYNGYSSPIGNQRPFMQPQQQQIAQPQPQMQPTQQIMQPSIQQPSSLQDFRYGTEEEAKAFIVYPNSYAWFIDPPKGRMYLKSANNAGVSSIDYFKYEPINADGSPLKQQEPEPKIDTAQFVSKDQLKGFATLEQYNKMLENYKFLEEQFRILQKQISLTNTKGNSAQNNVTTSK